MRMAAGLPGDQRKVRGKAPGLIYAFRDEAGTWWPRGHERLLPDEYAVGLEMTIKADRPSRFAGRTLVAMCALEPDALPDDSPGYVYRVSGGRGRRQPKPSTTKLACRRRLGRAVHTQHRMVASGHETP